MDGVEYVLQGGVGRVQIDVDVGLAVGLGQHDPEVGSGDPPDSAALVEDRQQGRPL